MNLIKNLRNNKNYIREKAFSLMLLVMLVCSTFTGNTAHAFSWDYDSGDIIDLMVVYTPAARSRYGDSGIKAKIVNAVKQLNDANARSQIVSRYRLVNMEVITYTESGSKDTDWDRLVGKTDGFMDNVHAIRDNYQADIVTLITDTLDVCGVAAQMTPEFRSNWFEVAAFNVVKGSCLSNHTLSHEIGHLEGCNHDRANAYDSSGNFISGAYIYSYGHRDLKAGFRTIMSYSCPDDTCPTIPYFSNPNVNYDGVPTGIEFKSTSWFSKYNSADNAQTKDKNSFIVANWRKSAELTIPGTPSYLRTNAKFFRSLNVYWGDNSDNEYGFYIERWDSYRRNWVRIATVYSNTTSYQDQGLSKNTTYYYRVQSFNGKGSSSYSNIAKATTLSY